MQKNCTSLPRQNLEHKSLRMSLTTHFLTMLLLKAHFENEALRFISKKWFFKIKNFINHAFFLLPNTKFEFCFFKMCFLPSKWDSKRALKHLQNSYSIKDKPVGEEVFICSTSNINSPGKKKKKHPENQIVSVCFERKIFFWKMTIFFGAW